MIIALDVPQVVSLKIDPYICFGVGMKVERKLLTFPRKNGNGMKI
jgi:hypothetical protein